MARKAKPKDMTFARNLQRLMEERSVGVRDLASRVGCSPANISDYRQGVIPQDFKLVRRMAHELGVTLSFLLTGEDDARATTNPATIAEVFDDGGSLFDGYARISIQRLIPRGNKKPPSGEG
jgi:transcriptional regulator with XRE-family HTH domain